MRPTAVLLAVLPALALLPACSTVGDVVGSGARHTKSAATEVHGAITRQAPPRTLDDVGRAQDWDDAMLVPASDLNIRRSEIPPALAAIEDPYAPPPDACGLVRIELARLDAALGPDYGDAKPAEPVVKKGGVALVASAVGDLLPFRGVVRHVSGASKRERRMREAYRVGNVRRGYLQGVAQERDCAE